MSDLATITSGWDHAARSDAMGNILTDGRVWDPDDFFLRGEQEVAIHLARAVMLGIDGRAGAALDFGCGVGRCTRALSRRFRRAVGVDASSEMIDRAWQLNAEHPDLEWVWNDQPALPFEDGEFACVYSFLVLQHMPNELSFGYLRELLRVLAPGGMMIIEAPDGPSIPHPSPWLSMWSLSRVEVEKTIQEGGARVAAVDLLDEPSVWDCWVYYAQKDSG